MHLESLPPTPSLYPTYPAGWSHATDDSWEYRPVASDERPTYSAYVFNSVVTGNCLVTVDRNIAIFSLNEEGYTGMRTDTVYLDDNFKNYLKPTQIELSLFELEYNIPYILNTQGVVV